MHMPASQIQPPAGAGGLSALATHYDAILLDIWGCVHDGLVLYPGVKKALSTWRAGGKKVVLLSNVPKGAEMVARQLEDKGLAASEYDALVTSGGAVKQALETDPAFAGKICHPISGPDANEKIDPVRMLGLGDLSLSCTDNPQDAGFGLLIGEGDPKHKVEDYHARLEACLAAGLEFVCLNPDLMVMRGGTTYICAGAIAARYEEMGGRVRYFGKPHGPVYDAALAHLGGVDKARILAVGDGPGTDMLGANRQGIDACLIAGGLHRHELISDDNKLDIYSAQALLHAAGSQAQWIMRELCWQA